MQNAIYLIESGPMLDMVKAYILEVIRVKGEVKDLALKLGVTNIRTRIDDGVLSGVQFPEEKHPEFTRPDRRGISRPRPGTEWAKLWRNQQGHASSATLIRNALNIPGGVAYKTKDGEGWDHIGNPLSECGFLYLSKDGPYGMWVPDVPAYVADYQKRGYTVEEPAFSFKMEFEGCRRIESEEWDIMVLECDLEEKKAKRRREEALRGAQGLWKDRTGLTDESTPA